MFLLGYLWLSRDSKAERGHDQRLGNLSLDKDMDGGFYLPSDLV